MAKTGINFKDNSRIKLVLTLLSLMSSAYMDILKPVYKTAIVKTVKSVQGKTFEGDFLSFRR